MRCSRADRPVAPALGLSRPGAVDPSREAVERVFSEERGRILATLIRLLGDIDLAEEALPDALRGGARQWPATGRRANPRAWLIRAARNKAVDRLRRARAVRGQAGRDGGARRATLEREDAALDSGRRGVRARRPAAPDLHLLPPGAGRRGAGGADAAHAGRPRRPRRSRARSWCRRRPWRSGWCARRRRSATARIPYRVPDADELPERLDAVLARRLPGLQRGLRGQRRRRAGPARAVRARRSGSGACSSSCCPTRAGAARAAGADAAPRRAARRARRRRAASSCCSRSRIARAGIAAQIARGRWRWSRPRCAAAAAGPVRAAGGDRRAARARGARGGHRLAQIAALYALLARVHPSPRRRAQPRGRGRDGGRARGGARG